MKNFRSIALYALICALMGFGFVPGATAQQDVITTVVGNGPNGIPALNADISQPYQVAIDAQGNRYFAAYGSNRVFKINSAGTITVVAGTGIAGYGGDGGIAANAALNSPIGVAVDGANPANVFISDHNNCLIRKVNQSTGIITTVAGVVTVPTTGNPYSSCGNGADGQAANKTALYYPYMIAVNPTNNNLYIADYYYGRIREVPGGASTGIVKTIAGTGSNCGGSTPYGDGGLATNANLCQPQGVTVDSSVTPANVFITGQSDCSVREVVGSSGKIYTIAGQTRSCGFIDNVIATSAQLNDPWQTTVKVSGSTTTVAVADYSNHRVRQFPLTYSGGVPVPGTITTVGGSGANGYCGDGGAATSACVVPVGLALDASGNLIIGDYYAYRIREITKSTGVISSIEGWGTTVNTTNTQYSDPLGISGAPGTGVQLYLPGAVFADPNSTKVYIAGNQTPAVYSWDSATTNIRSFAGNGIAGFAGDGALATSATVELRLPAGVAKDQSGNVYIADAQNCAIREVSGSTGNITTVVGGSAGHLNGCGYSGDGGSAENAQLSSPTGMAFDSAGNMYISEYNNCSIRMVSAGNGTISTVVGNHSCGYNGDGIPANLASLNGPQSVALDSFGNIYIPESGNNRIRKVDAVTGNITTIAGIGIAGYTGDGIGVGNRINNPDGIYSDANGNVFFPDYSNNIMRWVDPAGQMVTFAGTPQTAGFTGDGGPATQARISGSDRVARDAAGNTYFADYNNGRIRKVTAFAGYGRSTSLLSFDPQQIGTVSEFQPITLSAIGTVTIGSLNLPAGFSEIDDCIGVTLTAGQTCEVDVSFTPTVGGVAKGVLTIGSNAYFNGQGGLSAQGSTVQLQGSGAGLSISGPLVFATQLVGASTTKSVTLQNTGKSVKISSITVPGSSSFLVTGGSCPYKGGTLAAGASCTIAVTFSGTTPGTKKFTIAVASNDPGSPLLDPVSGVRTQLTYSPANLAFGTVAQGKKVVLNLTVTNSTAPFSLAPAISGLGFTILTTGNTCGASLAAGASCTLPVQFAPTAAQAYSGTVTLVSGNSASPVVALSGTGVPDAQLSTTALAFGSVTHGTTSTLNLTVKNVGANTLTVSTAISGSGAADFTVLSAGNTCTSGVAAGASCTLPVQFKPAAVASYSATLTVTTNGGSNPTVALTGTGK